MRNAILQIFVAFIGVLGSWLGSSDQHFEYTCNTCACKNSCPAGDELDRTGNLTSHKETYKLSYTEVLGEYGAEEVERVLGKGRRAIASGSRQAICGARRELHHIKPVLDRPDLANTALQRETERLDAQLGRACR